MLATVSEPVCPSSVLAASGLAHAADRAEHAWNCFLSLWFLGDIIEGRYRKEISLFVIFGFSYVCLYIFILYE